MKTTDARDSSESAVPPWRWNEFQQVGTDYLSIDEVRAYDKRMSEFRDIDAENSRSLEMLAVSAGASVLEIGTGTGSFARAAAKAGCRVLAIDVSPVMLEYASLRAKEEGVSASIEFKHAGFLSFEIQPGSLDAVETGLASHHLPDLWKAVAFDRLHAAMKPGARLHIRDVVFSRPEDAAWDAYFKRDVESIVESSRASFARHIRQEFSTLDWIMRGLLERAGFEVSLCAASSKNAEYLLDILAVRR